MKIKNLSLSFGIHEIFKNVNLDIPENEKVGIVGVNGAGKSTFFKLIMKRLEPDEGKIIIKEDYNIDLIPQVLEDEVSDLSIDVFLYLESGRPIKKLEADLQKTYEEIADILKISLKSTYGIRNRILGALEIHFKTQRLIEF